MNATIPRTVSEFPNVVEARDRVRKLERDLEALNATIQAARTVRTDSAALAARMARGEEITIGETPDRDALSRRYELLNLAIVDARNALSAAVSAARRELEAAARPEFEDLREAGQKLAGKLLEIAEREQAALRALRDAGGNAGRMRLRLIPIAQLRAYLE